MTNKQISNSDIPLETEATTVWSFPVRGQWATHSAKYRGNFAPQLPRNVIEMYSDVGDLILDPMVGGGTTLIEARLLHRNAIGYDINPNAVALSNAALNFESSCSAKQLAVLGNAKNLAEHEDCSVDLIVTHPPYMNIIKYSEVPIDGDLSNISSLPKFCSEMSAVAFELFRVLKEGRYCAVLIGDTRRAKHFVPMAYNVMNVFLSAGFILKEDIIKVQHNCSTTRQWTGKAKKMGFYLIMHEHLFIFRKPIAGEDLSRVRWSRVCEA